MLSNKLDAIVSVVLGDLEKFCTDEGEGPQKTHPYSIAALLKNSPGVYFQRPFY